MKEKYKKKSRPSFLNRSSDRFWHCSQLVPLAGRTVLVQRGCQVMVAFQAESSEPCVICGLSSLQEQDHRLYTAVNPCLFTSLILLISFSFQLCTVVFCAATPCPKPLFSHLPPCPSVTGCQCLHPFVSSPQYSPHPTAPPGSPCSPCAPWGMRLRMSWF